MPDQATYLRELVRHSALPPAAAAPQRAQWIAVFGGKGGVGTTTLSVNLAAMLAQQGAQPLLIDAAGGDASILCRLEPEHTVADVLAGTKTAAQVMLAAPGDFQIIPGARQLGRTADDSPAAWERLFDQLATMPFSSVACDGRIAKPQAADHGAIIVDAGSRPDRTAQRFWQAADRVLLVTTPEAAAVMDAYAAIKLLAEPGHTPPIDLLVNFAPSAAVADEVYHRLAQVCRRFLARPLYSAGHVPADPSVPQSGLAGEPFVLADPGGAATDQLRRLARKMCVKEEGPRREERCAA